MPKKNFFVTSIKNLITVISDLKYNAKIRMMSGIKPVFQDRGIYAE